MRLPGAGMDLEVPALYLLQWLACDPKSAVVRRWGRALLGRRESEKQKPCEVKADPKPTHSKSEI